LEEMKLQNRARKLEGSNGILVLTTEANLGTLNCGKPLSTTPGLASILGTFLPYFP